MPFEPEAAELPELVSDPAVHLWLHLNEVDDQHKALLGDVFGVHPLLIEDILSVAPSPKAEAHADYLYLIVHGLRDAGSDAVHTVDVDVLIGARFLVTHHAGELPCFSEATRALRRDARLLQQGPAFLAHHLIDGLVDEFLPLMERLDVKVAALEDDVMKAPGPHILNRIFELKHSMQRLRRVGIHQQRLLSQLAEGKLDLHGGESAGAALQPFFRDVHDHFLRVMDLNESYRELVESSSDAYLSMQSHRLNEVMKVLTVISTIMLPLTFITGLYGMNFDHMPGIHWRYGYETAWLVMLATAGGFYLFSKRHGWI